MPGDAGSNAAPEKTPEQPLIEHPRCSCRDMGK